VPNSYPYYWESADKIYKSREPIYSKLAVVKDIKEIDGGFMKSTSVIGADEMDDAGNYSIAKEDRPVEGFPVYWTIKTKKKKYKVPKEVMRDMKHRAKNWLNSYVAEVVPRMVETTKEKIVAAVYNYGGYTSGHAIFNQDDSDINLTTGYTSFCYDGKPLFALSGNDRTAKDSSTYYNALAVTTASQSGASNGVNFANAITMWNLLTYTNAKMENGAAFDNTDGVSIVCSNPCAPDWYTVQNSSQIPDNANNAANPLKGRFAEIIESPYITTATQSVMFRKEGLVVYFDKQPTISFYDVPEPEATYVLISLDYAIAPKSWRTFVSNNAPTS